MRYLFCQLIIFEKTNLSMRILAILILCTLTSAASAQKINKALLQTIQSNFEEGAKQYKVLKAGLPPDRFPKTYFPATGKYETSSSEWWCSGFYPGTLLYLYEQTHDTALYKEAVR